MIMPTDLAFDKIYHLFMIQPLNKLATARDFLKLIKGIY